MRKAFICVVAIFATLHLFGQGQVNYTALDTVSPYESRFRPGINMGFHPNWTNEQLATIGAGDPSIGQLGAGARAVRPGMEEYVFENFGYDLVEYDYQTYQRLDMQDITAFLQGPTEFHRDFTNYCPGQPSAIFRNIYLPIWDDGTDGTPYNDENFFAAYIYQIVDGYKEHVTFWEIWNEPGFDFTAINGRRVPGEPNNWWDNDPNPCDYALRAPIQSYVRMLRISWEIIKELDPDSYVTLGDPGFPSFLDAVLRNTDNPNGGAVTADFPLGGGAYFDCVSYHAYPHFDFTAYDPFINLFKRHSDGGADGLLVAQQRFQNVLDNYGFDGNTYPNKEWIVTEFNAPRRAITGPWMNGVELQRNYLLKVLMLAKVSDIAQMHIYELFDNRSDVEASSEFDLMGLYGNDIGVLPYNQTANQQAMAMKTFTDVLYETDFDQVQTDSLALPPGVRGYAFKKDDDTYVYALWAETTIDLLDSAQMTYAFPASFGLADLDVYAWDYGYSGAISQAQADSLILTEVPIFIERNVANDCSLTVSSATVTCDDNGTDSDPIDDIFSFEITALGNNNSAAWTTISNGDTIIGPYDTAVLLDSFLISDGNVQLTLTDTADATCSVDLTIPAPAPCSTPPSASYCASGSSFPWHEWIARVELGNIDNVSSKQAYTDFTSENTSLLAGQMHDITLTTGFSFLTFAEYWSVWIDFDKDNNFEPSELVFAGALDTPPAAGTTLAAVTGQIDIPANAATGTTRMRISMKRDAYSTSCEFVPFGEVEDYLVTILAPTTDCSIGAMATNITCTDSGTPNFGGDDLFSFDVEVIGQNTGSGWQSTSGLSSVSGLYGSPKNLDGYPTFGSAITLNIQDLENPACQTTLQVSSPGPCSNGGGTGTYCASAADAPWHEWIAKVQVGDLEWLSGKSSYSDFLENTFTLATGEVQTVQLTTGFSWVDYDEYWRVWIDFDKNGTFDVSEMVVDTLYGRPGFTSFLWSLNSEIQIPEIVDLGVTRMRVVMRRDEAPEPCGNYDFGETEDFSVNIVSGSGGGNDCSIFAQQTDIACQDNGTPSDPSDDLFMFDLLVNGANVGANYTAVIDTTPFVGNYGANEPLGPFNIAAGAFSLTVQDADDSLCTQSINIVPPATCSNETGPCDASSDFPWHDWIQNVVINDLSSPSTKSQYSDFLAKTYTTTAGSIDTLELTLGFSWFTYSEYVSLWIDFDGDGIYSQNESVLNKQLVAPPNGTYAFTYKEAISIPASVVTPISTSMRMVMSRDTFAGPCGSFANGEVEDYGVLINAPILQKGSTYFEPIILENESILIYPNPVGDVLYIGLGDYSKYDVSATLYNQFGQPINQYTFEAQADKTPIAVETKDLQNGAYWLRFNAPGQRVLTKRIMVQRGY